ncbi:hypothetical protein GRI62_00535 [Erythrobacter arachoides]|uniref:Thermonuclease family protein n=1 Tax=Aurantiacibacter arachoides TaxID=1850444 RepID=A0A844ZXX2_9SPHN|nr:hypothetical protein [Aurantiacibacter arachoides]MXO92092.1 hypothetical protein [Aurantiacibacter arachoides]GGD59789.1 hypothetical protein GCM10011411_19980 [Aurantiacibacter arachoides]
MAAALLILGASLLVREWTVRPVQWSALDRPFAPCGEGRGASACVIDGDTLAIGQRRVRLTGYDAPEIAGACEAERRLAVVARDELARWASLGPFELDGGAEPPRDTYGRELRAARRGDELLADTMVQRQLARRSRLDRGWC